jgi:hypothetical protein
MPREIVLRRAAPVPRPAPPPPANPRPQPTAKATTHIESHSPHPPTTIQVVRPMTSPACVPATVVPKDINITISIRTTVGLVAATAVMSGWAASSAGTPCQCACTLNNNNTVGAPTINASTNTTVHHLENATATHQHAHTHSHSHFQVNVDIAKTAGQFLGGIGGGISRLAGLLPFIRPGPPDSGAPGSQVKDLITALPVKGVELPGPTVKDLLGVLPVKGIGPPDSTPAPPARGWLSSQRWAAWIKKEGKQEIKQEEVKMEKIEES